jgi:mono/diheme cytochrome c family protein
MAFGTIRRLQLLCLFLLVLLFAETAWLAYPFVRDRLAPPQLTPEARGHELALQLGCFNCHGPQGTGGVPNAGSKWETVPSFHEGTPMMFVKKDADIREYILDGAPAAKRDRASYQEEMAGQAIHMPAFRDWVNGEDLDALVAFVRSRSDLLEPADDSAARGAKIVSENGCFACHGAMGSGGLPNPGSLKGYIPGFTGPDFAELVQNDDELREWITKGTISRLADDPVASIFLERQRIQMPAYERFLTRAEVDDVVAYIRWLAGETWRAQPLVP